jgi:hypothetical protein
MKSTAARSALLPRSISGLPSFAFPEGCTRGLPIREAARRLARHRNRGVRKRCQCARNTWAKCPHPWYLNFKWKRGHYRLSLDREVGRRLEGRTEAETEADRVRTEIRRGTFRVAPSPQPTSAITFSAFEEIRPKSDDFMRARSATIEESAGKPSLAPVLPPRIATLLQIVQCSNTRPDS